MAKLKVFYGTVMSYDERLVDPKRPWVKQFEACVVTTSQKRAAELIGTTLSEISTYWSKVPAEKIGNVRGEWALAHPHRVWAWQTMFRSTAEGAVDVTKETK